MKQRYITQICTHIPQQENGDGPDWFRAVYVSESHDTLAAAVEYAKRAIIDGTDAIGCVRVDEEREVVDAVVSAAAGRTVHEWVLSGSFNVVCVAATYTLQDLQS